jgi:hypothetical protein
VDGKELASSTGWQVRWGPAYAQDISAYLARGGVKTDAMRRVRFPLGHRLEMAVVIWQMWALLFALVLAFLDTGLILPTLGISLGMFLFLGATWPQWPTRNGLWQGVGLSGLALLVLVLARVGGPGMSTESLVGWAMGLTALGLFVGADYQGGVPTMRGGEVEHFGLLVPAELALLGLYLGLQRWVF